jgi:hypothetical protein
MRAGRAVVTNLDSDRGELAETGNGLLTTTILDLLWFFRKQIRRSGPIANQCREPRQVTGAGLVDAYAAVLAARTAR